MGDMVWWVVGGLALVAIGVGWRLLGRRSTPQEAAPAAAPAPAVEPVVVEPVAAPVTSPAVAVAVPPTVEPARVAPPPVAPPVARREPPAPPTTPAAPAAPAAPRMAPAPVPVAPQAVEPRVVERPVAPPLPKVARFELRDAGVAVLVLERADVVAWTAAAPLASTPVQRELLSDLLARAAELDGRPDGEAVYCVHVPPDAALPLARSEGDAAGSHALESAPPHALDPAAAANFAAVALALRAAQAQLPALRSQVGETKTIAAALHPKLIAQTEGRLKTLVQDLARYLREAEENYAGAIRKPVFIGRVDAACEQAAGVWQVATAAAAAARVQLEAQVQAPRFGEVQLEKSLAALRELQGQRRVMDAAARLLAGWEQLRLVLGDAAPGGPAVLRDAASALAATVDTDGRLAATLIACLDAAKAPDYVGKAEFNANRTAAREVLANLNGAALGAAQAALAQAAAALDAGFAGRAAQSLLLRVDAAARVVEVREPAGSTSSAAG